ncbi:MAG: hypothetical protein C5B51_24875 [Terriglobia bacterium]|nr:MAG: hypothetical protein C5B51_24875 [Terriglobia bacterium]
MTATLASLVLAPCLLALTGCDLEDLGGARYHKDFHYSYPLNAGGKLAIETFNGSVELAGWDQDMVDISGTKYGPSPEAADALQVAIANAPDSIDIRVARPSEFRGNRGARFTVRMPRRALLDRITSSNGPIQVTEGSGPGRFRTSNGAVRIQSFEGSLDIHTSNGSIELINVSGEVSARTSNGRIRAENLKGPLEATSSNGGITAILATSPADRAIRLETSNGPVDLTVPANFSSSVRATSSNGPITLHLPTAANARVVAHTSNASISSDFEMKVVGEIGKNNMDGTIGSGGPVLDLSTSNAPIRLLKM